MDYKSFPISAEEKNKTDNTYYDPSREQDVKEFSNYSIGNNIPPNTTFNGLYILINNLKENLNKSEEGVKKLCEDNKDYANRISKLETKLDIYEKWLIGCVIVIIASAAWSFLKQFPAIENDISKLQMQFDYLEQKK